MSVIAEPVEGVNHAIKPKLRPIEAEVDLPQTIMV